MIVIGLTGGTGAGKTSALRVLEDMGALILDCDAVYHQMLQTEGPMKQEIRERFGDVFRPDGALDRQKLGNVVFADPAALDRLDDIVFRHVGRELKERIQREAQQGRTLCGIDAIKLVEGGLSPLCHRTVAVLSRPELRIRRIMAREGISEEYARLRLEAQKPDRFYEEHCDAILRNDAEDLADFQKEARAFLEDLIRAIEEEQSHGKE